MHLAPFRAAIAAGADGIMLSHITATAYDPDNPASRSAELIRLLREDLGFDGLIVTDSLCMAAAANEADSEGAAVASLQAGVDLMVIMPTAGKVMAIRNAVIASGGGWPAERGPARRGSASCYRDEAQARLGLRE